MPNKIEIQPDDRAAIEAVNKIESKHPELETLLAHEVRLSGAVTPVDGFSVDCHSDFKAVHKSGTRPLKVIDLVVLHATQGGTARSVASYFTTKDSGGSATLVVDDNTCYRCLKDNEIPWGAPGANYNGFHIEQCGWSSWTTTLWSKTHRRTMMRAAYKTAYHCRKYGITVRWLTAANLKAGMRNGITTHAECTKAFGGDHTDPGTGWPRLLFMAMVRGYYATLGSVKNLA